MQEFPALFDVYRLPLICGAILLHLALFSSFRLRHIFSIPTAWASNLIELFNRRYNRAQISRRTRRKDSLSIALFLIVLGLATGLGAGAVFMSLPYGWVGELILLAGFLGIRPLFEASHILAQSLKTGLEEGRATLTLLTGRQSAQLDESAISTAGIETVATGTVHVFIAPVFWYALGGLPALFIFKLIDTASNMIDERSEQARDFGMAPRFLATTLLWPAVLTGVLLYLPGSLILPKVSFRKGVCALFGKARYIWPVFSAPVALFSGMLGVRLGGDVCIGCFERTGDIFSPNGANAEISDLQNAARLAALSVPTFLISSIGIFIGFSL